MESALPAIHPHSLLHRPGEPASAPGEGGGGEDSQAPAGDSHSLLSGKTHLLLKATLLQIAIFGRRQPSSLMFSTDLGFGQLDNHNRRGKSDLNLLSDLPGLRALGLAFSSLNFPKSNSISEAKNVQPESIHSPFALMAAETLSADRTENTGKQFAKETSEAGNPE